MRELLLIVTFLISLSASSQKTNFEQKVQGVYSGVSSIEEGDSNAEIARKLKMAGAVDDEAKTKRDLDKIDEALSRARKKNDIKRIIKAKPEVVEKMRSRAKSRLGEVGGAPKTKVKRPSGNMGSQPSDMQRKMREERDKARIEDARQSANANRAATQIAYENTQAAIAQAQKYKPKDVQSFIPVRGNQVTGDIYGKPSEDKGLYISPLEGIDQLDSPIEDEQDEEELSEYELRMLEYNEMFEADENCLTDEQLDELEQYLKTL